jgi:alpha-glucosidase
MRWEPGAKQRPNAAPEGYLWWQRGIIYQVYPRSFMDSNGDGIGDLPGITSKLDYLKSLGVTAVWISPIFPSPMKDFGYDVSDYLDIHPIFGTMDDFDRLLEEAHGRGMRVLLDYVPNHTSDQHPWFIQSRSSRDNPKRNWYYWLDAGPDGSPPNNWLSNFGGPAWTWDETTGQFYYHAFLPEQPDLNWRNPEVRRAMFDVLRFWLDRGVDGFRVDVIYHLMKDPEWRDNSPNPYWKEGEHTYRSLIPTYSMDHPDVHEVVAQMRQVFEEYDERVMIGEIYLPIDRLVRYYGENCDGCHLPFNFQLVTKPWDARVLAATIDRYEAAIPEDGWPNWVLGNHDRPRAASRVGGQAQARVAAMLLLTLRGTPTIYQGEEIGMENVAVPPEKVQDPPGKTLGFGRDPFRTPMQWDASENAGFTTGDPWLPLAPSYKQQNVAVQSKDPASILSLYRRLIGLRQSEDALMAGAYQPLPAEGGVIAYIRRHGNTAFAVALNLGHSPARAELPEGISGTVEVGTHLDREGDTVRGALKLRGDEGVVARVRG